jgi:hypothetical protein
VDQPNAGGDMTGSAEVGYQLGSHDAELERLNLQGRLLAPATRSIFEMAGIESGMKVGWGRDDPRLILTQMYSTNRLTTRSQ